MSGTSPSLPCQSTRYVLIDAIRGIAASAVVLYHVYWQELGPPHGPNLSPLLDLIASQGHLGVPIFFALSGFVIAHSIRNSHVTLAYYGRFVFRRILRLDPPYWATIAIALPVLYVHDKLSHSSRFPSFGDIAAHLFYLQEILDKRHIVPAFWTLCLEVQFYLVLVAIIGIAQWTGNHSRNPTFSPVSFLVFVGLWCLSLLANAELVCIPRAFFPQYWPLFFIGTLASWSSQRLLPTWVFVAAIVSAATVVHSDFWAAGATSAVLLITVRNGVAQRWTLGYPLQFLGRISYSWYLTHELVGTGFVRSVRRVLGDPQSASEIIWTATAAIVATIMCAYILYRTVELPAMKLSQRVKLAPSTTADVNPGEHASSHPTNPAILPSFESARSI